MYQSTAEHVMIDLETMGTGPDAPVISIGAVFFDPSTGTIGEKFYRAVTLESALESGAVIDAGTVNWWMKQPEEARTVANDKRAVSLKRALYAFQDFVACKKINVWGNGASFDNVILRRSFERLSMKAPWKYPNDLDVRTVVNIGRAILGIDPKYDMKRAGVHHNALDDAIFQAQYVSEIMMQLEAAAHTNVLASTPNIDPQKEKMVRETMERQGLINTICRVFKVPVSSVADQDGTETEGKPEGWKPSPPMRRGGKK